MEKATFICRIKSTKEDKKRSPRGRSRSSGRGLASSFGKTKGSQSRFPMRNLISPQPRIVCALPQPIPLSEDLLNQIPDLETAREFVLEEDGFLFSFDQVQEVTSYSKQQSRLFKDQIRQMTHSLLRTHLESGQAEAS